MKNWTLAIAVLALGAVACGDDDSKGDKDGGGNGGNNTGDDGGITIPDGSTECTLDVVKEMVKEVGQEWEEAPPWSQQDAMACLASCPGGETACLRMCENGEAFLDCYSGEILHCGADVNNAPCEDEYVAFGCCIIASCIEATTQAEFDACLEENCEEPIDELFTCSDMACGEDAIVKCASAPNDSDAGTRIINPDAKNLRRALGQTSFKRIAARKALAH